MTASGDDAAAETVAVEAADWFARLRGEPSDADRADFERWRTRDPAHGQAFDRVARRWEQTAFLANSETARARDLTRAARWSTRPRRLIAGGAAAAAAVALALFATLSGWSDRARPALAYANTSPSVREVVLDDGSRVLLDTGSALDVRFTLSERRLILQRGRARFSVMRDATRPFVVAADGGTITAHGTVFDVVHEGSRVRVTLIEGSVEVAAHDRKGPGGASRARMLKPGQQVIYEEGGTPSEPTPASRSDWPTTMLSFENARLDEAAIAVSRGSETAVTISGPAAALRISGAFRAGDPETFAQAATAMFGLDAARQGRTIVLTAK
jgi:transmembrane sensor